MEEKFKKFSLEIQEIILKLRNIIYSVSPNVQEKLWAGLPSYYLGDLFIRLIPFKDHINIEASGLVEWKPKLKDVYKFTPKNMMQIFVGQPIPVEALTLAFKKTLSI